ncbi:MAG: RNA-binding cell elongation regulator Jag/EloR [Bilifractor sp.]|nr:protein jag [Lachnospiraceae bacterium]MDY2837031.1 RNA-binding cell elongation regulator Jag/EloR [Bilifractor sp.]
MDFLEVSAKTVDDAITKACIELGLSSDQLEIQVISEGSSGFLGIGSKPAVIQVRRKKEKGSDHKSENTLTDNASEKKAETVKAEKIKNQEVRTSVQRKVSEEASADNRKEEKKTSSEEISGVKKSEKKSERENKPESKASEKKEVPVERTAEEIVTMKASASKFLDGIFKAMELPVNITIEYNQEEGSLDIDFEGDDMGILIGKRGQTLDSLQYLVSLVVNKDQKNYVRVKLDTEDYRRRRKETLENLANNIANKVRRSHHAVSLEAMNPYERRIIHSALQNNKYVETHSEGNEPYRHVVVTLKKSGYRD